MKSYDDWLRLFNTQNLYEFNTDSSGILWLKVKSLIRKDTLDFMWQNFNIILSAKTQQEKFKELYNLAAHNLFDIDKILRDYNANELAIVNNRFSKIESELYKMEYFAWGGDSNNSLDKQIVSFVKDIYSYDEIINKIENDIAHNTKNYTLSSWYNNWSAILTEHIFKSHPKVISAVGKIKSVDFFIDNIPMDLKITYLPKEFLKQQRKIKGFGNEITLLKKIAKEQSLHYDKKSSDEIIKYQISQQINDSNNQKSLDLLLEVQQQNKMIIQETICNKKILIKWLYENQGELRFGAENRLFMVLIDSTNLAESWKLKRNFKLIKPKIIDYLDNFNARNFLLNRIDFVFKQKSYKALSDIIFIAK